MLRGLGSVLVDSNNCHILSPEEFQKEETLRSYLTADEKPYALLKSATEEYLFSDLAFVTVKGNSAVGTKKIVSRYEYYDHVISYVTLQTPGLGATDIDGSLIFRVNGTEFSIDIRKPDWELVKPLYRTLLRLSHAQRENVAMLSYQRDILSKLYLNVIEPGKVKEMSFQIATEAVKTFTPSSYKYIWDNHGRN